MRFAKNFIAKHIRFSILIFVAMFMATFKIILPKPITTNYVAIGALIAIEAVIIELIKIVNPTIAKNLIKVSYFVGLVCIFKSIQVHELVNNYLILGTALTVPGYLYLFE